MLDELHGFTEQMALGLVQAQAELALLAQAWLAERLLL
jgi:hypothetical protein